MDCKLIMGLFPVFVIITLPLVHSYLIREDFSASVLIVCHHNKMLLLAFQTLEETNSEAKLVIKDLYRKSKMSNSLRSRRLASTSKITKYDKEFLILVASNGTKNLKSYLELIAKRRNRKTLLIILNPFNEVVTLKEINRALQELSENLYFYLVLKTTDMTLPTRYYNVISIKNNSKTILQPVTFNEVGKIVDVHDMEGMHIKCLALSYPPHITISDCDPESGNNCTSSGYLPELLNIISRKLNFTWSCDKEMNNNWGVIQV